MFTLFVSYTLALAPQLQAREFDSRATCEAMRAQVLASCVARDGAAKTKANVIAVCVPQ